MIAQLFIALLGVTAVALSQSPLASRRRWASVFGLVGQPFWFYAAWDTEQWGIFALCILYTITWGKGFYSNWIATMATPQAQPADARPLRTDAEIVEQTEALAKYLLDWKWGQEPEFPDLQMRHSTNHKAQVCWKAACEIQELITDTDVENAVSEVDAAMAAAQEGGAA